MSSLTRRSMLLGAAAAAWPLAANAQPAGKMRCVALFMPKVGTEMEAAAEGVKRLQELGWTDGKNLRIDYRWIARMDFEHLREDAAELVAAAPPRSAMNSRLLTRSPRRRGRAASAVRRSQAPWRF